MWRLISSRAALSNGHQRNKDVNFCCAGFSRGPSIDQIFSLHNFLSAVTDAFLPRVVELATTSSERQTKVAACELLHSLVLLTLGRSALQPPPSASSSSAPGRQQQQQHSMHALYRRVLPAILKLACDVDEVGRAHCDVLSVSAQSTPVITKA